MARLESEGKGGFYPTPPEEMEWIMKRVRVQADANIRILDPCCGKGDALSQWKKDLESKNANVESLGIELEKSRAQEAAKKLDKVLACGYEDMKMSHSAISAMYLNPPFVQMQGKRLEEVFLRNLSESYLSAGNLLILNIPHSVLRSVAKILASRFVDIRVYRFTDPNYEVYKQVIVYAKRRQTGLRSDKERQYQQEIEQELINFSYLPKQALPTLDTHDWDKYFYSLNAPQKPLDIFHSTIVEPEDIIASEKNCDFQSLVMRKMASLEVTSSTRKIQPALPLKHTHIAAAIAAGALPETMGSHLLVGVTKRVQEERKQINPKDGKEQEITTFKPKSIVRVFSDKGIFNLQ